MKRVGRWVLAIIALQSALVAGYMVVEEQRGRAPGGVGIYKEGLSTEAPQRVDKALTPLTGRTRDGRTVTLPRSGRAQPMMVHLWATWCPPCREELPSVMALAEQEGMEVAVVALDEEWSEIERFVGREDASRIILMSADEVKRRWGVERLPVTLWVEDNGHTRLRFEGARDWRDEDFVARWLRLQEDAAR